VTATNTQDGWQLNIYVNNGDTVTIQPQVGGLEFDYIRIHRYSGSTVASCTLYLEDDPPIAFIRNHRRGRHGLHRTAHYSQRLGRGGACRID
jgi:hypothetical protein